jgi:hypothetical protein
VRIVDEQGNPVPPGTPGEIEVRGPTVFLEYWRRPDATRQAFRNGWFRTGDTAVVEDGAYRILGRTSVDIIKTGGYKVSALEIEETLRTHPAIADCAVVGVVDAEWGERVCAAVELRAGTDLLLADLQAWAKQHLAPYKIPKALRSVPALPRNAMGKVETRCCQVVRRARMNPAVASLLALIIAILLSIVTRINVGLVAVGLAWLIGVYVAGLAPDAVIRGFPSSLFLTLVGVTLLFAAANQNGTLERLAERAVRIAHGRTRWLPCCFS